MNDSGNPLVSVIITTYHNENYLPRALESVLHQSYQNIELIVVDDNPPDSKARKATEEVMKKYPRTVYLRHPENRNGAAARNTGIHAAKGKYIAFLDNDDFYFSNHIGSCVKILENHREYSCVLCGVLKIRSGICWDVIPAPTGDLRKKILLAETALGTGSNLFVKADAVRNIHGFDESFARHQDLEFSIRLFSRYKGYSYNEIQMVKEMDGFSNMPDFERFLKTKRQFWEKFYRELNALTKEEQRLYYAGQYSALLYMACKSGDREKINWTTEQLKSYRSLNKKECLLITLSRLHLFPAYETQKTIIKKRKSNQLYQKVIENMNDYDLRILNDARKGVI